jgi:hypothetical protein
MISIATLSAVSSLAIRFLFVPITRYQADDETGGRSAQRDSSRNRQKRKPDAAVGASAENESDAAGDSQCGQRFLPDVFADVALAAPQPFIRIRRSSRC